MPKRNNPFKPNSPVHSGIFTGRIEEIKKIENALISTIDGNANHLLFIGERGIGKTSLLLLGNYLSKGEIPIEDEEDINLLTLYLSIDKNMTKVDLCRQVLMKIEKAYREQSDKIQMLKDIWQFVQNVEVAGTKINTKKEFTENEIIENLIESISNTVKKVRSLEDGRKDGIVFLIDEVDSSNQDLDLGLLIKKITEQLEFDESNYVLFILCGLPDSREDLLNSHESSLRIFEEKKLKPLSPDDCKSVIRNGLEKSNEMNTEPVQIENEALDKIAFFSEGYPHFIQQIGYCVYQEDTDNNIDVEDVNNAVVRAISLIGDRYYKNLYFNKINKDSYRNVLKIMSAKLNNWVTKQEIRDNFKGKESTLDNAISALCTRKIILRKPGVRGYYKLQWMGFALWINMFTNEE